MRLATSTLVLGLAPLALSQSLQESLGQALADYPQTTLFQVLLGLGDGLLAEVLAGKQEGVTLLIPDDPAVTAYMTDSNITDPTQISPDALKVVLQYHVMSASLKQEDFAAELGLTVPTLLKDELYNNRTAGEAMTSQYGQDATGQVLYVVQDAIPTVGKVRIRQSLGDAIANVRSGLEQTAELSIVDGTWGQDGKNTFQIVNKVLVPPQPCSNTIQNASDKLKALDDALIKTGLYPALDTSKNVTCLAPSTEAFATAENPQESLGKEELSGALLFHTLAEVTYTNYLQDGQKIKTLSGATVTVKMTDGDIYFNNAKVVEPNVLTNNGLIHM